MRKSTWVLIFILFTYLISFFGYGTWKTSMLGGGDNFGYYSYLPALFIHHDIRHLRYSIHSRDRNNGITTDSSQQISGVGEVYFHENTPVIKYTCGVAILESPAFLTAHLLAKPLHYRRDGYSVIYLLCLQLWNAVFIFIGLIILRRILQFYFQETSITLVLLLIGLGTNLYHFSAYLMGLSHGYLFTLYAALILFTIRYYKSPSYFNGMLAGLAAGMISLIRPDEIICLFIPLFYGISSFADVRRRVIFLFREPTFYSALLVFILCASPQLIYWKELTGHFFYYSYGQEGFDFKHPRIYSGLFGFKNGWLPYTPVMSLAIAGVGMMFFKKTKFLLPILFTIPLHIYVIYSWWCWNYINGLGSRPMIEMYPLMSIPLGFCVQGLNRYSWGKVFTVLSVLFFPAQQMAMTYQRSVNILWSEDSTAAFYRQTFFKTHITVNDLIVFDTNEMQPENPVFIRSVYFNDFEDSVNSNFSKNICGNVSFSFILDNAVRFTPAKVFKLSEFDIHPGEWIKISFDACNLSTPASLANYAAMTATFSKNGQEYKFRFIRIQNKNQKDYEPMGVWRFDPGAKGRVFFYTRVPDNAGPDDQLNIVGMNYSQSPVALDNLKIEVWR